MLVSYQSAESIAAQMRAALESRSRPTLPLRSVCCEGLLMASTPLYHVQIDAASEERKEKAGRGVGVSGTHLNLRDARLDGAANGSGDNGTRQLGDGAVAALAGAGEADQRAQQLALLGQPLLVLLRGWIQWSRTTL